MKVLLLDIGSTFIKYFIYNTLKKETICSGREPFPAPCVSCEDKYEVPSAKIKNIIINIFHTAVSHNCKKAFISVQMHGYLLKDASGSFSNYISWRDRRGIITDPRLSGIDFQKHGTALKKNLPAASLCTYKKDLYGTEFFTLGSYISYILTGVNKTHITDACASGFFDAVTLDKENIFKGLILPDASDEISHVGTYNDIVIYTPAGDHQTSFLGSGANEDKYLLNIGTASQLSVLSSSENTFSSVEMRPYFNKKRLITFSGMVGGDKLFTGQGHSLFISQIREALSKLPVKNELLAGGGGADAVFEPIEKELRSLGITCKKINKNIGFEGLKIMSENHSLKHGTMLSEISFSNFPIILKSGGLDFFIIDNEHGAFDNSILSSIIMTSKLAQMPAIIRLPDNSRANIIKLADMGAAGFLLPMTNNAEDIKRVVDYAKYCPAGKRGISTNRAHTLYNPPPISEYITSANSEMKIYAQIETKLGCDNINAILAVKGVDGIFIGPNDLAADLNCIGNSEPIFKAIDKLSEAAKKACKAWGIITTDRALINFSIKKNVDIISYGSEINMIKEACKIIKEIM